MHGVEYFVLNLERRKICGIQNDDILFLRQAAADVGWKAASSDSNEDLRLQRAEDVMSLHFKTKLIGGYKASMGEMRASLLDVVSSASASPALQRDIEKFFAALAGRLLQAKPTVAPGLVAL